MRRVFEYQTEAEAEADRQNRIDWVEAQMDNGVIQIDVVTSVAELDAESVQTYRRKDS